MRLARVTTTLSTAILVAACSASATLPSAAPSVAATTTASTPSPTTATTPSVAAGSPTLDAVTAASTAWIVYQSPDDLRVVRPDGRSSHRILPGGPSKALHPDWSRDGQRLTFDVDDADGTRDVWVADWDGANAERLVDCQLPCRDADSPAWSPDGTRIAFSRIDNVDGHNPGSKLQVVDVASKAITTLMTTKGAEYAGAPRWSPDGRSLVVEIVRYIDDGNDTSERTGQSVAVVDLSAATPKPRLLRPMDAFASYPDWHPTEDLVLFAEGATDPLDPKGPPSNLFTIRPDGTELTQVTHQGATDDGLWMPAFRLDGPGILATLVHRPDFGLTLATLKPDGSSLVEIGAPVVVPGAHSRQRPVPTE